MTEIAGVKVAETEPAAQNVSAAVQTPVAAPAPQSNLEHTKITGRFGGFTSGYWSLTVPLLSARYLADGVNSILGPVLKAKFPKKIADSAWAIGVGISMLGVTALYTSRTYQDMKRQFKEPLAWEFNKNPEQVGLRDMLNSKNTLVHDAVKNVEKRTLMRVAAHVPFFLYLVPRVIPRQAGERLEEFNRRHQFVSPKQAVNLGVGANAMYLASDALGRKRTFFEELQSFIDVKLNHKERLGEVVTAADLMNLYDLQARNSKTVTPLPKMDSPAWQDNAKLFQRIADLMNQTYGNAIKKEHADFTVPKMVYMLGMGLLRSDNPDKNLAYVEVANRYGIDAVKKVAREVNGGGMTVLNVALKEYPIVLDREQASPAPEAPVKSFTEGLKKQQRPDVPATTHTGKVAQMGEDSTQVRA